MKPELIIALIAGGFAIVGIVLGAGLTYLGSYFEHRRRASEESCKEFEREQAVLHGAFALCNFLAEKLNEWDESASVYALARLQVAQPYLAKLIDRSPQSSDRLMVSLVDLGLRLEALLHCITQTLEALRETGLVEFDPAQLLKCIEELSSSVEMVQILVSGELPFISEEEMEKIIGPAGD